jgi:hypothetical protein
MKIKATLIAAATLAVGVISSQAQVYSQNVVGYVNQVIPANSFQIIAGTLINGSDAAQTNGDINLVLTNGLVSDKNGPPNGSNSVAYVWDPVHNGVATYYYFNAADATYWEQGGPGGPAYPGGWYNGGGAQLSFSLHPGIGVYIQNKFSQPITITTVGNVFQGTNVTTIQPGFQLISFNSPVSSAPNTTNTWGLPANLTSSNVGNQSQNDTIFVWDSLHNGVATFYWFNSADATYWQQGGPGGPTYPAGFYDLGGSAMPAFDYPQVNQGFYLYHNGAAIQWTNSFSVQ